MNQTHYFFALKLPSETKMVLGEHMDKLREIMPFSRWVHPEDLHITLAFLGHAPLDQLESAVRNVEKAIQRVNPVKLQIDKLGTFGPINSPRIFWAGTEDNADMQLVRERVFKACLDAGFKLETRPFKPHITLARKWIGENTFKQDLLNKGQSLQPIPLELTVRDVVLYQTHLQKTPKYEETTVFPLT
ncbi:RNA 2',3'-cyclic phosphodiesterase [Bacillus sp. MRMR6]|uniref:RNA 2',3'-cyclic phosphodiesterase n=1 Tax=Bacillus sp. MRMR6 TaxID=1928617 RepID=UPI0020C9979F|nr:RNA 2',3'-cyclic phosphodiesterase [Bacillus sp. MRMR6]